MGRRGSGEEGGWTGMEEGGGGVGGGERERERERDKPSIFFRTRSTAPEQPPQVMVMLNL